MKKEESRLLRFLYNTLPGRVLLRMLASRFVSKIAGWFLDTRLSARLIPSFVRNNGIDTSEFECDDIHTFNEFFTRKIKKGMRSIDMDEGTLICPCDALLSVHKIDKDTVLPVKQSKFSVEEMLQSRELAEKYRDGICLVFRLCVNHYHRYCYIDGGVKGENIFIPGVLHTVRPIALRARKVFTENCREYTTVESPNFGAITQIEVGAMLVGKIKNHHGRGRVSRGDEKGMFLYGGSTVIVLLEKDRAVLRDSLLNATDEIPVKMGEAIGKAIVAVAGR